MKKCGEKYRLTRLLNIPEAPGWAQVGGTAVHETTEVFDLEGDLNPSPERVRAEFEQHFMEQIDSQVKRYDGQFQPDQFHRAGRASKAWPNKEDDSWWLHHGPTFVHNWLNFRRTSPYYLTTAFEVAPIELHASVTLGGVPVELYIDRVLEHPSFGLIIIDLKSGANMPKDPMQLAIYAEGLDQTYGIRPRWGQYFDCRKGVSSQSYDLSLWPRQRLDFEFQGIRKMQEEGIFLANPSNLCSSCGVREYCLTMNGSKAHTVEQPWQ